MSIELVEGIVARWEATSGRTFWMRRPGVRARLTTKTPRAPRKGRFKGLLCRPCGRDHRRLLLDLEERVVTGTSLRWIADSANRFLDQPDCRPLPYGFGFSACQPRTVTSRWSKPRVQQRRHLDLRFLGALGVLVVNKTSRTMQSASRPQDVPAPRVSTNSEVFHLRSSQRQGPRPTCVSWHGASQLLY